MTPAARPNLSLRRRTLLAAVIAAIGLGGATRALAGPELVNMQVVDRETGRPLHVWRHHGRLFVAGEPGARYALRVTNHTDGRVMVVMSVDGVNIFTGETAGYDQQGYVFEPHQSYDLTGWRKSPTEVAAFVFAPLPQSYAARTGRPADVGVIGIATFKEKVVPVEAPAVPATRDRRAYVSLPRVSTPPLYIPVPEPPPPPPPSELSPVDGKAASTPAFRAGGADDVIVSGARMHRGESVAGVAAASPPNEKLGTGHGPREVSVIHFVQFERATSHPQTIQQIEYDTYDNLVASGVIVEADAGRRPRPFPSQPDGQRYVPDPPPQD